MFLEMNTSLIEIHRHKVINMDEFHFEKNNRSILLQHILHKKLKETDDSHARTRFKDWRFKYLANDIRALLIHMLYIHNSVKNKLDFLV